MLRWRLLEVGQRLLVSASSPCLSSASLSGKKWHRNLDSWVTGWVRFGGAWCLGREVFMVWGNHGQLLQEWGVGWVFLAPILLICHIAHLKGFFFSPIPKCQQFPLTKYISYVVLFFLLLNKLKTYLGQESQKLVVTHFAQPLLDAMGAMSREKDKLLGPSWVKGQMWIKVLKRAWDYGCAF